MIVALAGGVGGAKLALGLSRIEPPSRLTIVVNTGDDFTHLGLHISPDVDTVMYSLAGIENPQTGWGLAEETWSFMQMLERLGGPTWFKLGDQDLATHVERSQMLADGLPLSKITKAFCERLNVKQLVLPMTDGKVRTIIVSRGHSIAFQDYFVKQKCVPTADAIEYAGADCSEPLAQIMDTLSSDSLEGIIVCPSNPFLSIGPMLAMSKVRRALEQRSRPVVAVSPIIKGAAVKGPAAKIMAELGRLPSCVTVAKYYQGLIDHLLIDSADLDSADAIRALGIEPVVTDIMMRDLDDRCRLARECCAVIRR